MKKITLIGAGNMGSAIIASISYGAFEVAASTATRRSMDRLSAQFPSVKFSNSNVEAVANADIVVLAVKPYIVDGVIDEISGSIKSGAAVVSVVAGKSISELYDKFGREDIEIYRAIPNTAIRLGKSVTFISSAADAKATSQMSVVKDIFERSGSVFVVEESKMAACTALASCGIAYFFRFFRALAEGSVELGLKADFATQIAALTAEGAAAIIAEGGHPEAEIDKVTTPGGLTIRGLNALEANGFSYATIQALKASI